MQINNFDTTLKPIVKFQLASCGQTFFPAYPTSEQLQKVMQSSRWPTSVSEKHSTNIHRLKMSAKCFDCKFTHHCWVASRRTLTMWLNAKRRFVTKTRPSVKLPETFATRHDSCVVTRIKWYLQKKNDRNWIRTASARVREQAIGTVCCSESAVHKRTLVNSFFIINLLLVNVQNLQDYTAEQKCNRNAFSTQ